MDEKPAGKLFRGAVASSGWRGALYNTKRFRVWKCSHQHANEGQARKCAADELANRSQQGEKETGDNHG